MSIERKIGIIGIVHEEAERDLWGTLERLAGMGYRGIEAPPTALLQGDVGGNVKRMADMGLVVAGTGTDRDGLADGARLGRIIDEAHALGANRVSMWWAPTDSREQLLRDADTYNEAGATLAREGLKLCYHNHHHELTTAHQGVQALSLLAERTNPASVSFEIDIAWATYAGESPARLLARFAGRVPAIHVKDIRGLGEPPQFTAVGTGIVDMAGAVDAATAAGVEWFVVEQDTLRNLSAFDTAAISAMHLRELGL